ncbi:MAG: winged helix-turn-helix domain-containing protein [Vicinamibacterales bacterium]
MTRDVTYRFGAFRLERRAYRLMRDAHQVPLPPKGLDLLFLLVDAAGELVTKADILAALWADVAVTDNAITQVVSDLRRALGDDAGTPAFVQTVPRRGYRFVATVEVTGADDGPGAVASRREAASPRSIAVLDVANVTGDAETAWLAGGLAETIAADLRVVPELRVVDRAMLPATAGADPEAARAAGLDLAIVGGFQRAGARLRVTARVTDVHTGETLVHAKADGAFEDVFALQDAIVRQLVAGLRLNVAPGGGRLRPRETASLEAYRALHEGRLRLESLDPDEIPAAIAAFERALARDPGYALAHCGLAHARFWRFQATRFRVTRAADELRRAVGHAEQAAALDPDLAEAHATRAFVLSAAGEGEAAVAAGRRAVALEPGVWRHQFRLGIAAWGEERRHHLADVVAQFPRLAYAYFATAMIDIARGDLTAARRVLDAGLAWRRVETRGDERFPSRGLHWLIGLVHLAEDRLDEAERAFEAERRAPGSRLFADEFVAGAFEGLGMVRLAWQDAAGANEAFTSALDRAPGHPPALIGRALARRALGDDARATEDLDRAREAIGMLREAGRVADAAIAEAQALASEGQIESALDALRDLLASAPPGHAGWMIPVDPLLAAVRRRSGYRGVAARVADRAR